MKRIFDFTAALLGLVVLSPLMLLIALLVRLNSPGPALFRQERVGWRGQRFRILKFRTMTDGAFRRGRLITVGGDRRVTAVGRVLRKFKLDELPQLINVMRGEMSLVGPRPEVPEYVERFAEQFGPILQRRPGITHRAAILFRDEESLLAACPDPEDYYMNTVMPQKLQIYSHDLDRESFMSDVRTIVDTVFSVARLPGGGVVARPAPAPSRPVLRARRAVAGGAGRQPAAIQARN